MVVVAKRIINQITLKWNSASLSISLPIYYVHASNSIDEAKNEEYLWSEKSEANGCGTLEYSIRVSGETHFEFRIPLGYIEEEDLDLSAYEGKILVMEINEWSS